VAASAASKSQDSTQAAIVPLTLAELGAVRPVMTRAADMVADVYDTSIQRIAMLRQVRDSLQARVRPESGGAASSAATEEWIEQRSFAASREDLARSVWRWKKTGNSLGACLRVQQPQLFAWEEDVLPARALDAMVGHALLACASFEGGQCSEAALCAGLRRSICASCRRAQQNHVHLLDDGDGMDDPKGFWHEPPRASWREVLDRATLAGIRLCRRRGESFPQVHEVLAAAQGHGLLRRVVETQECLPWALTSGEGVVRWEVHFSSVTRRLGRCCLPLFVHHAAFAVHEGWCHKRERAALPREVCRDPPLPRGFWKLMWQSQLAAVRCESDEGRAHGLGKSAPDSLEQALHEDDAQPIGLDHVIQVLASSAVRERPPKRGRSEDYEDEPAAKRTGSVSTV
jgi:hypothetical protein